MWWKLYRSFGRWSWPEGPICGTELWLFMKWSPPTALHMFAMSVFQEAAALEVSRYRICIFLLRLNDLCWLMSENDHSCSKLQQNSMDINTTQHFNVCANTPSYEHLFLVSWLHIDIYPSASDSYCVFLHRSTVLSHQGRGKTKRGQDCPHEFCFQWTSLSTHHSRLYWEEREWGPGLLQRKLL